MHTVGIIRYQLPEIMFRVPIVLAIELDAPDVEQGLFTERTARVGHVNGFQEPNRMALDVQERLCRFKMYWHDRRREPAFALAHFAGLLHLITCIVEPIV